MAELRHDPLRDHWVLIAEERAFRPREWSTRTAAVPPAFCPFCPGYEPETPPETAALREHGTADGPGWRVRVVPNKFPALTEFDREALPAAAVGGGPLPAWGGHEVVIETAEHDRDLADQPADHIAAVLGVYRDRAERWLRTDGVETVVLFKNAGESAGATLSHPHGQVLALPIVPPAVLRERGRAALLRERRGLCPTCLALDGAAEGGLVVERTETAAAVCPWAPRAAYETWVLPVRHVPSYIDSDDALLAGVAATFRRTLRAVRAVAGTADHNWVLVATLPSEEDAAHHHWRIEVFPRTSHFAGFELGSGMVLNVVAPERAAGRLRAALA